LERRTVYIPCHCVGWNNGELVEARENIASPLFSFRLGAQASFCKLINSFNLKHMKRDKSALDKAEKGGNSTGTLCPKQRSTSQVGATSNWSCIAMM
jgi:hypothetical protein